MAWLTGWKYRKSITLSRSSGAVSNYQMKLLVGESSGATGETVDCGGLCLSTFNDIRFAKSDGTTLLDYWIESITGTTPNQLATIWIEFDSIGTTATTFYMYYGKSDATAASNGANTFLFFDDFPGSSIDTEKWNVVQGDVGVGSGILALTGTTGTRGLIESKTSFDQGVAWRARLKSDANKAIKDAHVAFRKTGDWTYRGCDLYGGTGNDDIVLYVQNGATLSSIVNSTYSTISNYHVYDGIWYSGNAKIIIDGSIKLSLNTNVPSITQVLALYEASAANYNMMVDWVAVRLYKSTEPAWGTWGSEEYEITGDTSETATLTDEMTGQSMTDGIAETATITDLMERTYETGSETAETATFSDLMECLHLVDGIDEVITFLEYGTGAPQNPHRRKQMLWNIQNKHISLKFEHSQAGRGVHLVDCAIRCGRIRREDSTRFVHMGQHIKLKFEHNVAGEGFSVGTLSMQVNRVNNPSAAPRDVQSVRFAHQGSHMQLKFRHNEAGKTILLKSLAMTCNRTNNPP